jgi:hypothetical protein
MYRRRRQNAGILRCAQNDDVSSKMIGRNSGKNEEILFFRQAKKTKDENELEGLWFAKFRFVEGGDGSVPVQTQVLPGWVVGDDEFDLFDPEPAFHFGFAMAREMLLKDS